MSPVPVDCLGVGVGLGLRLAVGVVAVLLGACDGPATDNAPVQFVDVARESGLLAPTLAGPTGAKSHILEANTGGAALFDYDADGDVDVFLVNGWRFGLSLDAVDGPSAHLYRNDGKDGFVDVSVEAGVGYRGWGMGCAAWDADGDGWTDLFLTAAGPDVYFHNQGDGTFEQRPGAAFGDEGWSTGLGAADFDADGDVDVYVARYLDLPTVLEQSVDPGAPPPCSWRGVAAFCGPVGLPGATDVLQLVDASGAYQDHSQRLHPWPAYYGLGVLASDVDFDGDVDIHVANDSTPNLLYRNDAAGFTDLAVHAGVAVSRDGRQQAGMGLAAGDVDGDGGIDFVVTNFSHDHVALYASQPPLDDWRWQDASYLHDVGRRTLPTLGWGTGLVDFDNDTDLDLFVANGHVYAGVGEAGIGTTYRQPNQLFLNDAGVLRDETQRAGPGFAVQQSSRGAAFGDIDDDGDVDILVVNLDAAPTLLRNDGGNDMNWLAVQLEGDRSNRSAIGALVEVTAAGVRQVRELRAGTGYLSQDDQRLHFGLGQATTAHVRVRWPDGRWQDTGDVASGQRVRLSRSP